MKLIFVSAYSQGYPHDSGECMIGINQVKSILQKNFDLVYIHSFAELRKINPIYNDLTRDYSERIFTSKYFNNDINYNLSWMKVGLMMWKPRLIFDVVRNAKHGDIIIYHDLNFNKYQSYLSNFKLIGSYYSSIFARDNIDVVLCRDTVKKLSEDVKFYLINKYYGEKSDIYFNYPGFWVGSCAFKKTKTTTDFLEKWVNITECMENTSPFPDVEIANIKKDFCWHAPEQSTLAVLYHSSGKFKKRIKIAFVPNRSFKQGLKFKTIFAYRLKLIKLFLIRFYNYFLYKIKKVYKH